MKMAMEMVKKKGCSKKEIEKKRAKTSKNNKIHKFEVFIGQKGEGEKGRERESGGNLYSPQSIGRTVFGIIELLEARYC